MSTDAYSPLHESVRRWIDERQWNEFTNIQAAAIPTILAGKGALLVAPTAGGKTEAALLPIVSTILTDQLPPVSLLYVAPLRALINDQANRAELLLRDTPLRSAWWHGDLSHARRMAIAKNLPDALLTTPESLEVQLSSQTYSQGSLLGNVRFVLIDEIHAFAENDRGAQLISLLARLEALMRAPFVRVGLSATIGNPSVVSGWMASSCADAPPITVIAEPGNKKRALHVGLIALERRNGETVDEFKLRVTEQANVIVGKHVVGRRSIVFVPSRARAETLTAALRAQGIETLIHHGSLSVEMRRAAEEAMKRDEPKTIVATSTLELGIDIGDLEQVVQLGPLGSVASWLQRIGRSGRSKNATSVGLLYALNAEELPSVIALCDLANNSASEALAPDRSDFSVAFHQILNFVRERDRVARAEIGKTLRGAGCFIGISTTDWNALLDEMIESAFLELADSFIQLGPQTEREFGFSNYRDFYSVFEAESGWIVKHGTTRVGSLPADSPMPTNREVRFVLAGSWWRVVAVDAKAMVVQVDHVNGGKAPAWHGGGGDTSFEVMQRTAALIAGAPSPFITDHLRPHMTKLVNRAEAAGVAPGRMVVGERENGIEVITYAGERINRYLGALVAATAPHEGTSSTSAEWIRFSSATGLTVSDVADFLDRVLRDPAIRMEAENRVLMRAETPTFGKFGVHLGPRSKVAAWRSQFTQLPHLEAISKFVVTRRVIDVTRPS